jgi:HEPN domain-containing protein
VREIAEMGKGIMESDEWLKQSDYDMETAEYMFQGGRYFYAVFMCHMTIEKALKGVFHQRYNELPPKTHNLIYLLNKVMAKPEEPIGRFVAKLNESSVATRYPEQIESLQKAYTKDIVRDIIDKTGETLSWIKKLL